MKSAILHHYKRLRAAGYTADAALMGARSHLYFVERLHKTVKAYKQRSAAAKKGHKTRKAAA